MNSVEAVPQSTFPAVGNESLEAVRKAVREALAEHGRAGRSIVVWRNGKIAQLEPDENGRYVEPA